MTTTTLIGDVHGKFRQYKAILSGCESSIQVGDLGVGFRRTQGPNAGKIYSNPPHYAMARGDHRFIRGNHDNPNECYRHSQWIQDGAVESGVMFVGGALSIDRAFRQEGFNWWPDEELSTAELMDIVDAYVGTKPRVMVTHDCPEDVAAEVSRLAGVTKLDPRFASRTRQAFQSMWSAHSPELWVFGHWHHSFDAVLNGTRFVCLAELETMVIDL